MEFTDDIVLFNHFLTFTIAIIVLLLGRALNNKIRFLKDYSIPDPVTGGLIVALLLGAISASTGIIIDFDLMARDTLLVYFFTTIGLNASVKDLLKGGKPLLILFVVTVGFIFVQNFSGMMAASIFGLPSQVGVIGGSISLIGGHGTTIAWSPIIAEQFGIPNALEIGIACATLGLVIASIMGGPVGRLLITRYKLKPKKDEGIDVGLAYKETKTQINYINLLNALLVIHIAIFFGRKIHNNQ